MKSLDSYTVRPSKASDWSSFREICCLTGNDGNPIEKSRWPFFSELWIGPYERHCSEYCFALTHDDIVVGYITSHPSTSKLNLYKKYIFNPILAFKVMLKVFSANADTNRFIDRFRKNVRFPEDKFTSEVMNRIDKEFPAHLHINILKDHRGSGNGSLLLKALFEKLRKENTKGLHLYCGNGPLDFYLRNGFKKIASVTLESGAVVNLLCITLGTH